MVNEVILGLAPFRFGVDTTVIVFDVAAERRSGREEGEWSGGGVGEGRGEEEGEGEGSGW